MRHIENSRSEEFFPIREILITLSLLSKSVSEIFSRQLTTAVRKTFNVADLKISNLFHWLIVQRVKDRPFFLHKTCRNHLNLRIFSVRSADWTVRPDTSRLTSGLLTKFSRYVLRLLSRTRCSHIQCPLISSSRNGHVSDPHNRPDLTAAVQLTRWLITRAQAEATNPSDWWMTIEPPTYTNVGQPIYDQQLPK